MLSRIAVAEQGGPVTLDFTPLGAAAASAATSADGGTAPMDESFGHYPMSVFGIASAIHRYDGTSHLDDGPIAYAIVAIRDWERRFPRDPWIARELLAMQRVYEHAHTGEGNAYAHGVAMWLQSDYPTSTFANSSRNDIANGGEAPKPKIRETPKPPQLRAARHAPAPAESAPPEPDATPTIPSYAQPG